MVLFNYSTKELTAKIVYYGPGLCGKTTNLQFIYESLPEDKRGRMLSLSTQTDRTLYFDFLPVEIGEIRGMSTRVQLYTVPGQVFYNETRKMVLKGVDGVVFVADSQSQIKDANLESFRNLEENLKQNGLELGKMPLVLQFNKRDLPSIAPVEEMNNVLNLYNSPFYEAIASTGIGVHDTLKAISKLVLLSLSGHYDKARSKEQTRKVAADSIPEPAPPPPPSNKPAPRPRTVAAATPPATAAPPPSSGTDDAWEDEALESELERMDASEIHGLLAEVEGFDGMARPLTAADTEDDFLFDAESPAPLPEAGPDETEISFADLDDSTATSGLVAPAPATPPQPPSPAASATYDVTAPTSLRPPPTDVDLAEPIAVLHDGSEVQVPIRLEIDGRTVHYTVHLRLQASRRAGS